MSRRHFPRALGLAASLIGCVVLAIACSSAEDAAPGRTLTPQALGPDGGEGAADATSDADPSCVTASGCFSCEPQTLPDFYNACTEGQCAPFDNVVRLPLFQAGKALPPVP